MMRVLLIRQETAVAGTTTEVRGGEGGGLLSPPPALPALCWWHRRSCHRIQMALICLCVMLHTLSCCWPWIYAT